jgi:hypothetical protein
MTGRVRKIECNRDRAATPEVRRKISGGGEHEVLIIHADVAYAEHENGREGFFCIVCGDGPLTRVRSDNKYTSR